MASEHHQLYIKTINIDKNNFNDLNIPLKVDENHYNNRNNHGKFLRKLWHRSKSSNDFMAYEKELNILIKRENFRNEGIEQPENVNSSIKLLSPNRNKVKMGTRVYNSMNRSYNEINNLDECNIYIPTKNRYSKKHSPRCISVTKYSTDNELLSQQSSSSKYFNLDSDGVACNSNEAYVIGK